MLVTACVWTSLLAIAVALWTVRAQWSRFWFELEDPRSMAAFRIALTLVAIANVAGLWPWHAMLLSSEGILDGAEAARTFAPGSFAPGLLERAWAIVTGPVSLLYLFDGPAALGLHLAVFGLSALAFLVGWRTRAAGIVMFFAMDGLLVRNFLFWEGTEIVIRVFTAYLVCARCGHAYGVDAWRYRRDHPEKPRYRPIPAWPRRLAIVQLAVLLGTTGLLKTGDAWLDGDAIYYALHSQHYARFVGAPSWSLGLLRVVTWVARTIEALFPLVLVGVVGRWARAHGERLEPRARRIVIVCTGITVVATTVVVATTGQPRLLPVGTPAGATVVWLGLCLGTGWVVYRPDAPRWARWPYRRGPWLVAAAALMSGMWLSMNIGWFHPAVLACLIPLLEGEEVGRIVQRLTGRGGGAGPSTSRLAYGPRGRRLVGGLLAVHLMALALVVIPSSVHPPALRAAIEPVLGAWLRATRTQQSWGMWAPEPRMDDPMLRVVVVDADGVPRDLGTDLYALRRPVLGYDRRWKINGRILSTGASGPYARPFARWHCRQWAEGHAPARRVELYQLDWAIPPPTSSQAALVVARPEPFLSEPCG
ncbi:MAG: hypothetical protein KC501_32850 [Myxococcales bacterium]|nr:hypothetical protein [Myxococcales bacterium]